MTADKNRIPSADDLRAAVLADPGAYGLPTREARNIAGLPDERIERTLREIAAGNPLILATVNSLDRELASAAVAERIARLRDLGDRMWDDDAYEDQP